MAWNDLELKDKARMIQLAVKSGITDLRTIQEVYNKFEDGGLLSKLKLGRENTLNRPQPLIAEPASLDTTDLKLRQKFMETGFSPKRVSKAGAIGDYQIMPSVLKEYTKATGIIGDLNDPVFNESVRDWYMNDRLEQSAFITKGNPTDSVKYAKKLLSYNYGPTNTVNGLNKAKADGLDIYTSLDWLTNKYFPNESVNYANFILRNKDVNAHKNQKMYDLYKKMQKK